MCASRNVQETELVQALLQRCQSADRITPTQNANRARCARPVRASTEGRITYLPIYMAGPFLNE